VIFAVFDVILTRVFGTLQAGNTATQVLLRAINLSGKLHMVPAVINTDYVIRFAVCSVNANDDDILYAWNVIADTTSKLASQSASFDLYIPDQQVRHMLIVFERVTAHFDKIL